MRRQVVSVGLGLALLGALSPSAAADGELSARFVCPALPVPGRVLCEVDLDATRGRLVWGDVLVVQSPDFARPLRARVGPPRAPAAGDSALELALAFMATRPGRAPVQVLARAVVCDATPAGAEPKGCRPKLVTLTAEIAVGEGL